MSLSLLNASSHTNKNKLIISYLAILIDQLYCSSSLSLTQWDDSYTELYVAYSTLVTLKISMTVIDYALFLQSKRWLNFSIWEPLILEFIVPGALYAPLRALKSVYYHDFHISKLIEKEDGTDKRSNKKVAEKPVACKCLLNSQAQPNADSNSKRYSRTRANFDLNSTRASHTKTNADSNTHVTFYALLRTLQSVEHRDLFDALIEIEHCKAKTSLAEEVKEEKRSLLMSSE